MFSTCLATYAAFSFKHKPWLKHKMPLFLSVEPQINILVNKVNHYKYYKLNNMQTGGHRAVLLLYCSKIMKLVWQFYVQFHKMWAFMLLYVQLNWGILSQVRYALGLLMKAITIWTHLVHPPCLFKGLDCKKKWEVVGSGNSTIHLSLTLLRHRARTRLKSQIPTVISMTHCIISLMHGPSINGRGQGTSKNKANTNHKNITGGMVN